MIDFDGTENDAYRAIVELFEQHPDKKAHQIILHDFRNMMGHITGALQVLHLLNDDSISNADNIIKTVNMMDPQARRILALMNAYFRYQMGQDGDDSNRELVIGNDE